MEMEVVVHQNIFKKKQQARVKVKIKEIRLIFNKSAISSVIL